MKDKSCNNNEENPEIVVLMVPLPAQGHLNQLLHLSRLITSYGIPIHYAGSSTHNHQVKIRINGLDSEILTHIHFHDLQLPVFESPLPKIDPSIPYPSHFETLFEASTLLRQPVYHLIQQLSEQFKRVIVIHDILMASVVQDVKLISNAEAYTFVPSSAFFYFSFFWEEIPENDKPFQLDCSIDFQKDIPTFEGCITPNTMDHAIKQMGCLGFESGWVFNTSRVIEGKYVTLLEKLSPLTKARDPTRPDPPHRKNFAIGPFLPVQIDNSVKNRHQCVEWLHKQEKDSVIYVSFGSTTSLTNEQIEELAIGLEKSGEKFIWVVRRADPNDVFSESDKVERPKLPEGYEERVKDRGIVITDWAPQLEILAHSSVGGFMSHCGWNSCIESITIGVPIAAWPMHSDQPRNAFLVSQVLKIGVVVRDWEHRGELVSSSTIENAVKKLMASKEGKEMQKRAKELGEDVVRSLSEGGVSRSEMDSFIAHISR